MEVLINGENAMVMSSMNKFKAKKTWQKVLTRKLGYASINLQIKLGKNGR